MCGILHGRSTEDEYLLLQIGKTNRINPHNKVAIFDARPFVNALANRVNKGGYENTRDYYTNCEIIFCDIDNIHIVNQSLAKLYDFGLQSSFYLTKEIFFSKREQTGWL
jgi:myotubularin-related protein 1/2